VNLNLMVFMNVLLVEDNPADVRLTREAFHEAGMKHHIDVVMDGSRAIDFLRKVNGFEAALAPHIVLLDLNLPGKSGREVLHEIKSDRDLRRIPVIVVSNSQALDDVDAVYRLHGKGYLAKPDDFEDFIQMIRSLSDFWLRRVSLPSF
jgi:chemotaxis family two-component system response regulator Rcp1